MYYVMLGLIQGLTEFLPVSSSGHLVISQYLLDIKIPGVAFETFVHFGTSLAVIVLFNREFKGLFLSFLESLNRLVTHRNFFKHVKEDLQCKFAWLLLISTIPGAFIGFYFHPAFENLFSNPIITSWMLIITGICLFLTDKILIHGAKKLNEMNVTDAILIGFAQALAIMPGISRSGFTIMMSLSRKLDRAFAAKYSFILSVPIILGASIYKIPEMLNLNIPIGVLIASGMTAFLTGYWAIKFFIKMLVNFKLRLFSYYLWIIGFTVLILNISNWK
jgi:undecaprenyl-diphosphatase